MLNKYFFDTSKPNQGYQDLVNYVYEQGTYMRLLSLRKPMTKASKKPEEIDDDDFEGESEPAKKEAEKKLMEKV